MLRIWGVRASIVLRFFERQQVWDILGGLGRPSLHSLAGCLDDLMKQITRDVRSLRV